MMPSLFLCHGAPYLVLQDNEYSRSLQEIGRRLGKPRAILLFSAHFESPVLRLTSRDDEHETIYDFSGFPPELYTVQYPAKGWKALAGRVRTILGEAGIPAQEEPVRGLDHGAWVLLHHMYPDADVPVIAASINRHLSPAEQYRIGQAVSRLKEEDVLIIASGGTSHNLRMLEWDAKQPADWTIAFDDWLLNKLDEWDTASLFDFRRQAPHADWAVPPYGPEHFLPLFIAMGAGEELQKTSLLHRSYDLGTLSLIGVEFA